ncbi:hypothetical protein RYX36_027257 [Vicia faba]
MTFLSLLRQNHFISATLSTRPKPKYAAAPLHQNAGIQTLRHLPLNFEDKEYVIEELTEECFNGVDIALFSAGGSISKKFGPIAVDRGTIVVDKSSAFRMDENVPLVIPEVNPEAMAGIRVGLGKGALIANPNCSTIICLVATTPLHRRAKVQFFF